MREFRNAVKAVPDTAERARESLTTLDAGVRRANSTMLVLAGLAIAALLLSTVALLRAETVSRASA